MVDLRRAATRPNRTSTDSAPDIQQELRMTDELLARNMQKNAEDAVILADIYFSVTLDYSAASIDTIEELIETNEIHYSMPQGKSPENIELLSRVWGAYLGEVFRRHAQGEWVYHEDPAGPIVALRYDQATIFPCDKVRKRLIGGAEEHFPSYYRAICAMHTPKG